MQRFSRIGITSFAKLTGLGAPSVTASSVGAAASGEGGASVGGETARVGGSAAGGVGGVSAAGVLPPQAETLIIRINRVAGNIFLFIFSSFIFEAVFDGNQWITKHPAHCAARTSGVRERQLRAAVRY
jgi:hypothetical protein